MNPAPAAAPRRSAKSAEASAPQRSAETQPALERVTRVSSIAEALSRWLNQQL